jgi:energy-coupling factor transport system ATP-binding protein
MTISFQNVDFHYEGNRPVLSDLSFSAQTGEVLLIVGQNGVGKSTLLKLLNGILKPSAGRVHVGDLETTKHPTSRLAREICVTFQNPADQIFAPTIRKEVEFGPQNLGRKDTIRLVDEALAVCGLEGIASHHPYDLPPAQRKLLTIASALASGAPFVAFDEPTAGLSQIERSVFENVLAALKRDSRGMIVVSHDLALFLRHATRVLVIGKGKLVYFGTPGRIVEQEGLLRRAGLKLPVPIRLSRMATKKKSDFFS